MTPFWSRWTPARVLMEYAVASERRQGVPSHVGRMGEPQPGDRYDYDPDKLIDLAQLCRNVPKLVISLAAFMALKSLGTYEGISESVGRVWLTERRAMDPRLSDAARAMGVDPREAKAEWKRAQDSIFANIERRREAETRVRRVG